jgi:hypothetical protein
MKHIYYLVAFLFLLTACSRVPQITSQLPEKPIFGDADVTRATLNLGTQGETITPQDLGELSDSPEAPELPDSQSDAGEIRNQAVLPNANGFVYYIRYQSGSTDPWSVQRANQATDVVTTIYSGQREIQAVGGSADGNTIVLSMRQTAATTSDFEIYRLTISSQTTEQLSNDTVDNTDVTMTANAVAIAWQQPVNNRSAVAFRTGTTTRTISLPEPIRQPSLSANGNWLVFVRKRSDGLDQVIRYNLTNNSYIGISSEVSASTFSDHPSISNAGDKIMWLRTAFGYQYVRVRDLTANTFQTVVGSSKTLEHPSITADGNFATYGYSAWVPARTMTVYTINLSNGQKAVVRSMPEAPAILQLGMVWQKNPPTLPQANEQPVTPNSPDTGFGWSPSISGNTAVIGGRNGTYVLERSTNGLWQVNKTIQIPIETPNTQIFFPNSSAISGDTIVIGTSNALYDIDNDGVKEDVGAAFVYERNQGGTNNWGLVKELISSDRNVKVLNSGGIRFGGRVAIEGDSIVVTAGTPITTASGTNDGAVYVFSRNQGGTNNWGQVKRLVPTIPQLDVGNASLSLSNGTLIVGSSPGLLSIPSADWAAYIFARDKGGANNWGEVKRLTTNDSREAFGYAVSISGDIAVVAAFSDYDANRNGTIECGRQTPNVGSSECDLGTVHIFSRNQGGTNNWGLLKKLTPPNFKGLEQTLITVAISNNRLILGSPRDTSIPDPDGNDMGAVYVFEQNVGGTNNWGQIAKLLPSDLTRGTQFGWQIAFQNSTLLVSSSPYVNNSIAFFYTLE